MSSIPASISARRAYGFLALVMLMWAGNSIVGRAARDLAGPFTLSFVRWTIASLILVPFAARTLAEDWPAIRRGWKLILLLGVLGVATFNGLLYKGLHYTTAANALLLQASIPALVLVAERLGFGVRASAGQVLGVAISTIGVVVIVARGDPGVLAALALGRGEVLILLAVVGWALYTVGLRLRPAIAPASFLLCTFALGALAMAPMAMIEHMQGQRVVWGLPVIATFVYVGVFPSVIAFFLFNRATADLGAATAGQAITLMPVFGALLSALLLGERLEPYHWAGIALVLAGIMASVLAARHSQHKSSETAVAPPPPRR
jgi:drug/metabolite transporter (DMT)-like permease